MTRVAGGRAIVIRVAIMQDTAAPSLPGSGGHIKKKVVIVDDSRTIRSWLRVVLEQDPRLEVVGEADCAETAREVIKRTTPDVLTLDIEMPGMNGLAFLEKLMTLRPMPVVMISGATASNSEATITALSLGAVDCILKPTTPSDLQAQRSIIRRVFSAACSTVFGLRPIAHSRGASPELPTTGPMPVILIGASTGGVAALETVLSDLHSNGPPVVIVQHMPGPFLVSFSQMLNRKLDQDVAIARAHEALGYGQIRLAPAQGQHTTITRVGANWQCRFVADSEGHSHCPAVDVLFGSGVKEAGDVISLILTGLGRDGATAMRALRDAGAMTLGQDQHSSVVYGMPRAAWDLGAVQSQLPLDQLGAAVNRAVASYRSRLGG